MENEVDTINLLRKEDLLAWLDWLVTILPSTLDPVFWFVSLVIILLLRDVWKACKRWAPWIPGLALVLSPFIIHLLSFIRYSGSRYQTVIDSERLMMCVLIAYSIPGMALSGFITDGSDLAGLAWSMTFRVVSEFRSDWKVEKRNESLSALVASSFAIILILEIIYLLLLLIHAATIGRTIRRFISRNVPAAISCCTPYDEPRCSDIKDHVLKCWIVARLCQPDYVLSRSSLCSTLWPTVTFCFGFYIINWIYIYSESLNSVTIGTLVQIVLVGIGWIVLLVRWVTSDRQGNISGEYYIFGSSLQDLMSKPVAGFIGLFVRDKRIREKRIREILWYPRHWLSIIKQKLSNNRTPVSAEDHDRHFSNYEGTLKMLLFRGESARSLWKANQWGFSKVERYMAQGHEDGRRRPSELISLLRRQTGTTGGALRQANRNSWKRTAVSLIHFMIDIYDGSDDSVIEKAMQCYIEAWEYMDFVDGLNEEVKSLGRQADEEFDSLEHSWMQNRESRFNDELSNLLNPRDSTDVSRRVIRRLQCVLANVYLFYMTEGLIKAVIQKCSELAEKGMEEKIFDVAFLLAKARGVMDEAGVEPRRPGSPPERPGGSPGEPGGQASTSSHSPTAGVEPGGPGGRASTSSDIPTVTTSAELMASEEQVKPLEEAVKVTEIEPMIEGPTEEEAPACSPTQEVPEVEKKVDESPPIVEKSAEEITVMPHASELEAESAPVESGEVSKLNDSTKMPEQAEPAKRETVGQPSAEGVGVEEKAEGAPTEEKAEVEGKSEE